MHRLALSLCIISALLLAACATTGLNEEDSIIARQWKGSRIQNVMAKLGTPDQIIHEAGGHVLYLYLTHPSNTFNAPQPATAEVIALPRGKTIGVAVPQPPMRNNNEAQCSLLFETNANNIIVKTAIQGSCEEIINLSSHH